MKHYEFTNQLIRGETISNKDFSLTEHSSLNFLKEGKVYKITIQELD